MFWMYIHGVHGGLQYAIMGNRNPSKPAYVFWSFTSKNCFGTFVSTFRNIVKLVWARMVHILNTSFKLVWFCHPVFVIFVFFVLPNNCFVVFSTVIAYANWLHELCSTNICILYQNGVYQYIGINLSNTPNLPLWKNVLLLYVNVSISFYELYSMIQ